MKKIEWIPLYPAEFLADLNLMTPEVGGAYVRLCFTLYNEGGTLPNDNSHLATVCGFDDITFKQKIWPQIKRKFMEKNGVISQKRCTLELKKARRLMQVRSNAGLTAAKKRWQTHNKRIANAHQTVCVRDAQYNTIQYRREEKKKKEDNDGFFTQISDECFKWGLPESEAQKIHKFCLKKKIKVIYSLSAFIGDWKRNPVGAQIELTKKIKAKEKKLTGEKLQIQSATSAMLHKIGVKPVMKKVPQVTSEVELQQNKQKILNQLSGKR